MANGNSNAATAEINPLISGLKQMTPAQKREVMRLLNVKKPTGRAKVEVEIEEDEEEVVVTKKKKGKKKDEHISFEQLQELLPDMSMPGNFQYSTAGHPLEDALLLSKHYAPTKKKREKAERQLDALVWEGRKRKAGDIATYIVASVGTIMLLAGAYYLITEAGTYFLGDSR